MRLEEESLNTIPTFSIPTKAQPDRGSGTQQIKNWKIVLALLFLNPYIRILENYIPEIPSWLLQRLRCEQPHSLSDSASSLDQPRSQRGIWRNTTSVRDISLKHHCLNFRLPELSNHWLESSPENRRRRNQGIKEVDFPLLLDSKKVQPQGTP